MKIILYRVNRLAIILIIIFNCSCENTKNKGLIELKTELEANQLEQTELINEMPDEMKVEIALKFINGYIEKLRKIEQMQELKEWIISNPLASNSFKQEYIRIIEEAYKVDPELGLGIDPILDAQDYPDEGFILEKIEINTNFILLKGNDWDQFKLIMKLKKENGQWLVDGSGIINIPKEKQKL